MRNLLYLLTFFLVTPIVLATSLFTLSVLSSPNLSATSVEASSTQANALQEPRYGSRVYAALPDSVGEVAGVATVADARLEIIRQYLEKYKSPLLPYAQELLSAADKYDLDFRLLVAIAQQESNLCKKVPEVSYNCWGWGVHSRGTLRFASYPEAIEVVAKGLREEYFDKGYQTPEEIMQKYTPLSPGSWAKGIRQFMAEME